MRLIRHLSKWAALLLAGCSGPRMFDVTTSGRVDRVEQRSMDAAVAVDEVVADVQADVKATATIAREANTVAGDLQQTINTYREWGLTIAVVAMILMGGIVTITYLWLKRSLAGAYEAGRLARRVREAQAGFQPDT